MKHAENLLVKDQLLHTDNKIPEWMNKIVQVPIEDSQSVFIVANGYVKFSLIMSKIELGF